MNLPVLGRRFYDPGATINDDGRSGKRDAPDARPSLGGGALRPRRTIRLVRQRSAGRGRQVAVDPQGRAMLLKWPSGQTTAERARPRERRRMNHFLRGLTCAVAESFALPEPIVEVGSYQVAGQ